MNVEKKKKKLAEHDVFTHEKYFKIHSTQVSMFSQQNFFFVQI